MSQTFAKQHLADALHTQCGWPKNRCAELLDDLGAVITQALARGHIVILPGLGRLDTADSPERPGRNPRTGEPVTIPARRRVTFKPAKKLKESLE